MNIQAPPPGIDPQIWQLLVQFMQEQQNPAPNTLTVPPGNHPPATISENGSAVRVGDLFQRPSNLAQPNQAPIGFADLMDTGPNTVPRGPNPSFLNWSDISNQTQAEMPSMTS